MPKLVRSGSTSDKNRPSSSKSHISRENSLNNQNRTPNALDMMMKRNFNIDTSSSALLKAASEQRPEALRKLPKIIKKNDNRDDNQSPKSQNLQQSSIMQQNDMLENQIDSKIQLSGLNIDNQQLKRIEKAPETRFSQKTQDNDLTAQPFQQLFKAPPPDFPPDLISFYYVIQQELLQVHPTEGFNSLIGLQKAKQTLKESVILPQRYPQLFTGILTPWKGCLLFSAPGNGKSHLARALAAECNCAFFNVSAASLLSKYYGESEKLIRTLFLMAHQYENSVIFIDELDCLMTSRDEQGEHEASKRLKTQLLVEIDGLLGHKTTNENGEVIQSNVFVLCATNLPWQIDAAMLRRLEKRVYCEQLNEEERKQLVQLKLGDRLIKNDQGKLLTMVADKTVNWSGSDICCLCKEAAMIKLRKGIQQMEGGNQQRIDMSVGEEEIEQALQVVRPSYNLEMEKKYKAFMDKYGSV